MSHWKKTRNLVPVVTGTDPDFEIITKRERITGELEENTESGRHLSLTGEGSEGVNISLKTHGEMGKVRKPPKGRTWGGVLHPLFRDGTIFD